MEGTQPNGRHAGTPHKITRKLSDESRAVISCELDQTADTPSHALAKDRADLIAESTYNLTHQAILEDQRLTNLRLVGLTASETANGCPTRGPNHRNI